MGKVVSTVSGVSDQVNEGDRRDTHRRSAYNKSHHSGAYYNLQTGPTNIPQAPPHTRLFSNKTVISHDAELESMVMQYRTRIVRDVIVRHILSSMRTFIDTDEINEIIQKDGNAAAMEALLDTIQKCKKKGRWQGFVDALRKNNYDYICSLLQGGCERKGISVQQRLLEILTPDIINRINPGELARHLRRREAINQFDLQAIEREETMKGKVSAASMLLNILPRSRSADWAPFLCDALRDDGQEDLAKQFIVHYDEIVCNTKEDTSSSPDFEDADTEQVELKEDIAGCRRNLILMEEKRQVLEELQRKEENLEEDYGYRPDFTLDVLDLRRKLMALEGKELLLQELTKKERDFKMKFGKDVEDTEDTQDLVKRLADLQTKMLLKEQIQSYDGYHSIIMSNLNTPATVETSVRETSEYLHVKGWSISLEGLEEYNEINGDVEDSDTDSQGYSKLPCQEGRDTEYYITPM